MKAYKQNYIWCILFLLFSVCTVEMNAQDCDPDSPAERYRSRDYFPGAPTVLSDVAYGTDATHRIDIYLPAGDSNTNRPLALWAHGGSFVSGTKTDLTSVLWCTEMAKMGYVAVSLEYRQELLESITEALLGAAGGGVGAIRGVYIAIQDGRSAIRFLKANAGTYGINPNQVFFAGSSAGGIIAANVAYMEEAERTSATYCQGPFCNLIDLGCIDCGAGALVDNSVYNGDIDAGVGLWSAVEDYEDGDGILDIIDDWNDADGDGQTDTERMLFLHGGDDLVVLPGVGKPFAGSAFSAALPDLYGTYPIRERLASMGANAPQWEAHVLCAEDHGFGINNSGAPMPDDNLDYIMNEITDHFYNAIDFSMPQTGDIETIVEDATYDALDNCDNTSKGTYASTAYSTYSVSSPNAGSDYCWDISKGTILTGQSTPEITVRWNDDAEAMGRTGTVLCYEKTTAGSVETVYKSSQLFSLIDDGPATAPSASFTSLPGAVLKQIDFTDASANANHPTESYVWDFGDGTSMIGTMANPTHTYAMLGTYTVKLTVMNESGNRSDFTQLINVSGLYVAPKAHLKGPSNGTVMNTDLNAANLIPSIEPYTAMGVANLQNAGLGFVPTYVAGTGSDEMVDWVLVELRDANTPATIMAARAAILQKDGDVVDIDGSSAVGFIGATPGMYHVTVRHRNHLGVMTGMPLNLN